MKIIKTGLDDLFIIQRKKFTDHRGALEKFYEGPFFAYLNLRIDDIYTTNSGPNVVRGMHHQISPFGQTKIVCCLSGSFIDIAVDLRPNSRTYKKIYFHKLAPDVPESIIVPTGFSHGTYALEKNTIALSLCSGNYLPEVERGINIKTMGLDFIDSNAIISENDLSWPSFEEFFNGSQN